MSGSAVAILIVILLVLLAIVALVVAALVKFRWVIFPVWIAGKIVKAIDKKNKKD